MAENPQKLNAFMVLEILKEHSDADHPIAGQKDIIKLIEQKYGLEVDRHTLKRKLLDLVDYGFDVEYKERTRINKHGNEESINYDWYLERDISDAELHLLIDGLLFSKCIPYGQCNALVEKLERLSSKHFRQRRALPKNKPENKQLLFTIEMLNEAIANNNRVGFQFTEYGADKMAQVVMSDDGTPRIYKVSPYEIVVTNGRYYLICAHSKGDTLFNYRLDHIREIEILEKEKRRPIEEMAGCQNGLDLSAYLAEHIYMYSGESVLVRFCADEEIFGHIIDWFGQDVIVTDKTEDMVTVTVKKVSKRAMFYWALQYGPHVEVLWPDDLREDIRAAVEEMHSKYSSKK